MVRSVIAPLIKVCLMAGFLGGCSVSEKAEVQSFFGYSMGTSYSIKVVSTLAQSKGLQLGVEGVLSDIDNRMSTYLKRSDISVFSNSSINQDIVVDAKTISVVSNALDIANSTAGYFDPTIAPLVDLWGFGPDPRNQKIPDETAILDNLKLVGFKAVTVNSDNNTLKKTENRQLDLSAIAKGYAVDLVSKFLEEKGFNDYLVEVGGEMKFSGSKPDSKLWRIAIESPDPGQRNIFRILEVSEGAVATSGNYRNFFEIEGRRYSHTIDPSTGYPVNHDLASVTVYMDSCMDADAYATAFMAMGREKALTLANDLNIAVFMIYKKGDEFNSVQSNYFQELFGEI